VAHHTQGGASNGVIVEKASIDEAYVQLPAGSVLASAAPAAAAAVRDLVRRRLNLVLSVGAAHNKLLAKMASVASKPDGVLVVSTQQDVAALLARTPAARLPGCSGAVAARLQTELGARVASDLAGMLPARLTAALGLAPAVAAQLAAAAAGECKSPVVHSGGGNRSVGVHMTLTATPRAMPAGAANQVSAAGGRAGMFEPLRWGGISEPHTLYR
jgi:DNA polymerase-4